MESDIIKISHLNKSFGEVKAVNDLSFRVKKGELFAFLGVNGAGKSTTISILCGLLKKDSGTVQVNGIETDKAGAQTKRMFGVVFQDSVLDFPAVCGQVPALFHVGDRAEKGRDLLPGGSVVELAERLYGSVLFGTGGLYDDRCVYLCNPDYSRGFPRCRVSIF